MLISLIIDRTTVDSSYQHNHCVSYVISWLGLLRNLQSTTFLCGVRPNSAYDFAVSDEAMSIDELFFHQTIFVHFSVQT